MEQIGKMVHKNVIMAKQRCKISVFNFSMTTKVKIVSIGCRNQTGQRHRVRYTCALERESAGCHLSAVCTAVPAWSTVCHTHAGQEVPLPAVCNTKISLLFSSINYFNI